MTVTHVGSSIQYANNWNSIFGGAGADSSKAPQAGKPAATKTGKKPAAAGAKAKHSGKEAGKAGGKATGKVGGKAGSLTAARKSAAGRKPAAAAKKK